MFKVKHLRALLARDDIDDDAYVMLEVDLRLHGIFSIEQGKTHDGDAILVLEQRDSEGNELHIGFGEARTKYQTHTTVLDSYPRPGWKSSDAPPLPNNLITLENEFDNMHQCDEHDHSLDCEGCEELVDYIACVECGKDYTWYYDGVRMCRKCFDKKSKDGAIRQVDDVTEQIFDEPAPTHVDRPVGGRDPFDI